VLLLLLLLDLDEFDRRREKPEGARSTPLFLSISVGKGGRKRGFDVRGGETAASAGEKDLAQSGLEPETLWVRVIVAIVPRLGSGLELDEGAVGREEQPV
jgi:hypothetical protein